MDDHLHDTDFKLDVDAEHADAVEVSEEAIELVRQLEAERDDAMAARTRALADYSNFQRRAEENEARARTTGAARIARSIIPIIDNFDLALGQDLAAITVEQMADGVKLVRDELSKALESHGVDLIEPVIGDEFDPALHEAMYRQPSPDAEPNTIVDVLQPGYAMGELVLRAAKVAVAEACDDDQDAGQNSGQDSGQNTEG